MLSSVLDNPSSLQGLIVEDEPADEAIVRALLEGARLDAVSSVKEAGDVLGRKRYDFILCDLHLRDSRGINTVKDVVAVAGSTPVIALTSKEPEVGDHSLEAGAQDFIAKDMLTSENLHKAIKFAVRRVERDEARRRIADLVARDLRDPLALLETEVAALRFGSLTSEQNMALEAITRQLKRMREVVSELQTLVRG